MYELRFAPPQGVSKMYKQPRIRRLDASECVSEMYKRVSRVPNVCQKCTSARGVSTTCVDCIIRARRCRHEVLTVARPPRR